MKRALAVALTASAMLTAGAARADWSASAGFENFRWEESTSPAVKESGLRWALDLTWAQSRAPGLSAGYNLKFYNGKVDYTGATLFGGLPASNETQYRGLVNEVQAWYRMPNMLDFMLALGWDHWDRRIRSTTQEETWNVLYAKLGLAYNLGTKQGFIGTAGVKYPAWTREDAHFDVLGATNNPRVRPGRDISLYATAGYRFNAAWDVIAYYDSYRFKQSNTVAVAFPDGSTGFFFQPESKMDVFGMKVQYNFQ